MHVDDTIVAIASSHEGHGLRGIVRVSGPETITSVRRVFHSVEPTWNLNTARRYSGHLMLGDELPDVDAALYLWPTKRSYTCQPLAEIHTHGAKPLLDLVIRHLTATTARLARPGEFTLRAFLAGRMDLAQAEAVLGVIDAVNERELHVALGQLAGGLTQPLTQLRNTLLDLCADIEAGLDFVDEDIEFVSADQIQDQLSAASSLITNTLQRLQGRNVAGALPRVVLRGEPNVGKSSLWNRIVGNNAAIVTDQQGTTRDYLTGTVDHQGQRFTLIDTAGVEPSGTALQDAIRKTSDEVAEDADLILLCIDANRSRTRWELQELERLADRPHLTVAMRSDQGLQGLADWTPDAITTSTISTGFDMLIHQVTARLEQLVSESSVVGNTAARCRESLQGAADCIQRARELSLAEAGDELIAAEIRLSLDHLGQVVGVVYTDDILDRVFSRFCIGK